MGWNACHNKACQRTLSLISIASHLSKINNQCLFKLKEKSLRYFLQSTTAWANSTRFLICSIIQLQQWGSLCRSIFHILFLRHQPLGQNRCHDAISNPWSNNKLRGQWDCHVTWPHLCIRPKWPELYNPIEKGFNSKCSFTELEICDIWELCYWLSTDRGLVLMDGSIVVLKSLRKSATLFALSPPRYGWHESPYQWFNILAWYERTYMQCQS